MVSLKDLNTEMVKNILSINPREIKPVFNYLYQNFKRSTINSDLYQYQKKYTYVIRFK